MAVSGSHAVARAVATLARSSVGRICPRITCIPTLSHTLSHTRVCARLQSTTPDVPSERAIVRFRADDGEEHFGVFADVDETRARIAEPHPATGKLTLSRTQKRVDVVLPPVDPPAIFAIGLNYIDHAKEVKMDLPKYPIVFSKSVNALTGHNAAIVIPKVAREEVDYEAELAVVIGRECKNVRADAAMDYVLGYTIANDVTARKWQGKKGGGQWIRSKCFDTFLPLGPYLVPKADVPNPHALRVRTWINRDLVQDGNTSQTIFNIPQLIEFLSQGTTLLPGTVILTGTPAGVGYVRNTYLKAGDIVRVSIDGLGTLRNVVAEEIE